MGGTEFVIIQPINERTVPNPHSANESPIQFDDLEQLLFRFDQLSRVVIHPTKERSGDWRKGFEFDRPPAMFDRLVVIPGTGVNPTKPLARRDRPWVQFNGTEEFTFRPDTIPILTKQTKSQCRVSLGKLWFPF